MADNNQQPQQGQQPQQQPLTEEQKQKIQEKQRQYQQFFHEIQLQVLQEIYRLSGGVVQAGPFKEMRIIPKFCWGFGDSASKICGTYESELYPTIEKVIESKPDVIVNIGCAEGFYGLGMAMRLKDSKVHLRDIDDKVVEIVNENAKMNAVSNYDVEVNNSPEQLESLMASAKKPFVMMDIEGKERELLDPNVIPSLKKATIMVESHDCFIPDLTSLLTERFKSTHNVISISQGAKNPYIEITKGLPDFYKMMICVEGRPSTMNWLYMTPKK